MSSLFRKDIVSNDWILVASGTKKRPNFFANKARKIPPRKNCPFEDPQKSGNGAPIFWCTSPNSKGARREKFSSWFLQVLKNKYPVLIPHKICPIALPDGPYQKLEGAGFQEVVITRDHTRSLGYMSRDEICTVLNAYLERYFALKTEKCIEYILIFHNNGLTAGASVPHPHSQILALPIVPPDVRRSLDGSAKYFSKNKKCVHCDILNKELRDKKRIIYKNKTFIVVAPYASRVSFEIRLFPLAHNPNFENIGQAGLNELADAMRITFAKLKNVMNDPDYNFFIHTAPVRGETSKHYHWHMEILPRTSIWGGVELGTGIEIIKILPEEAAQILRSAKS